METRTIELARPVDLRLTCGPLTRGSRDPSNRIDAHELRRAANTPDGPATLMVCVDPGARRAEATAWGPGAGWALAHTPDLIGADDDIDLCSDHPAVAAAAARSVGLRIGAARAVADVVLPTVIDQRVTSVEAKRTWFGLVRRFGTPAPGPLGLRVPPHPERIGALGDYERRRHGLELRRGAALVAVALACGRLQRAADLGSLALQRELQSLPGVGPWTAAITAALVCGDPDVVAVGDWHLPRQIGWALAREGRADDARMLELLEPFRPQRGRVVRTLLAGADGPPRTAPRAEISDHLGRDVRGERDYRIRRTLRFDRL